MGQTWHRHQAGHGSDRKRMWALLHGVLSHLECHCAPNKYGVQCKRIGLGLSFSNTYSWWRLKELWIYFSTLFLQICELCGSCKPDVRVFLPCPHPCSSAPWSITRSTTIVLLHMDFLHVCSCTANISLLHFYDGEMNIAWTRKCWETFITWSTWLCSGKE